MFNAELFIESLFEDTTQSTLVFDLVEGISSLLPTLYEPLVSVLPEVLQTPLITFEESHMLAPIFLASSFVQGRFHIDFDLPCELNVLKDNQLCGSLHITLTAAATFVLKSEGGSTLVTEQAPPTTYDNYAPDHMTFTKVSFDLDSVHFIAIPKRKGLWTLKEN